MHNLGDKNGNRLAYFADIEKEVLEYYISFVGTKREVLKTCGH